MKKIFFITSLVASISFLPSLASAESQHIYRQPLSGVIASSTFGMTEEEKENIEKCKDETGGSPYQNYFEEGLSYTKYFRYNDGRNSMTMYWEGSRVKTTYYESGYSNVRHTMYVDEPEDTYTYGSVVDRDDTSIRYIRKKEAKTEDYDWCVSNGYETS